MKIDLEQRLVDFASLVIKIAEVLPDDRACGHLAGQLIRSGTAPALIYGEAQGAESRKDFVHKMKLGLKELRETYICLKILEKKPLPESASPLQEGLRECNELISIFVKSVITAEKNMKLGTPRKTQKNRNVG